MPTQNPSSATPALDAEAAQSRKRLRKLIILVVLISVGVHLVAGIGAGIWVIARYFTQPKATFTIQKTVDMKPEERKHRLAMEEVAALRPKPVYNNRIQSLAPSKLALPELPNVPLDNIVPLDTEALISDQIDGVGNVDGSGDGSGDSFFGRFGRPGAGLLEGTFYDLKQTSTGESTDIVTRDDAGRANHDRWVGGFIRAGMPPGGLNRFFQAPKKVYMSQLIVPNIPADSAPQAFGINVPGSNWVIVYRGTISPPQDGTYRFAGAADDTLVVRMNNRIVLDASWQKITRWSSDERDNHMRVGRFGNVLRLSDDSIVYGDWVSLKADKSYPIAILVGEQPGESFSAALYIQERGVEYPKDGAGRPVLPRFRTSPNAPEVPNPIRPYGPGGPVFRTTASAGP